MSNLWSKLASRKPSRVTVTIEGDTFECRGMLRSEKNALVSDCTSKGVVDNNLLESRVLAYCVVEPGTDTPIQPLAAMWDEVPAEITGPLVGKCSKLCGFDESELVQESAKKSDATGSSD